VHHLKTSFDDVSDYCNNFFTDAIDEARRICRLWGVDPLHVPGLRVAKKKRHFDELAEDTLDERRTALPNQCSTIGVARILSEGALFFRKVDDLFLVDALKTLKLPK